MTELEEVKTELREIKQMFTLLLDTIVIQQKDACVVAGVNKDTPRNRFLSGDLEVLSKDGSSHIYLTLNDVGNLKKRSRPRTK